MKARYSIAAATAIVLAGASPAVGQRASLQATATVIAPAAAPTVSVVAMSGGGDAGVALASLVVEFEPQWGVMVQVGDGPAVAYGEPEALRHVALRSEVPVRVTVAAN